MDFLKLIRSFEELLFEALSWVIYYPRTIWLVFRHPLRLADYKRHEDTDTDDEPYPDTLSPPLLLLLTLVIAHGYELNGHTVQLQAGNAAVRSLINSDQNIVILRSFVFGLLPLFAAMCYVARKHLGFDRRYLRAPFFGECYLAAVYALAIFMLSVIGDLPFPAAHMCEAIAAAALTIGYLGVRTLLVKRSLELGTVSALGYALLAFVLTVVSVLALGALIGL